MLSESVMSVRKELFQQNKTAVSDMPKANIQMKAQPADADMMVQTSLSFENIYYSLWEIAGRYSSFCQFRVIDVSHFLKRIFAYFAYLISVEHIKIARINTLVGLNNICLLYTSESRLPYSE